MEKITKSGLFFSFTSGLVASLALPPHGFVLGLLALSYPALKIAHANCDRRKFINGFWIGCATGFGWFIYSLFWISHAFIVSGGGHEALIPFAAIGLPLFLSLFWGAAFALAVWPRRQVSRLLILAATLSLSEYARGHILTGFPWNTPGMVLADSDLTLGIVSFTGLWAGGLLIILIGLVPALLYVRDRFISAVVTAVMICLFILSASHINPDINPDISHHHDGFKARLVQPNIDQNDKWNPLKRRQHLTEMMTTSRQPVSDNTSLDMIVWPESAFAGFYDRERSLFNAIMQAASSGKTPIVTGTLSSSAADDYFNSAVVFDPRSGVSDPYRKRHLVPFGEYAPLRHYIPFIDAIAGPKDFSQGREAAPLVVTSQSGQKITILPLICYEVIFPNKVRRDYLQINPDVMINLTNDAWFGDTIGPRQHLAMVQLRAAELGIPVIRVANTGISAMINPYGQITHMLDYGKAGYLDAEFGQRVKTYYAGLGDRVFVFMLFIIIFIALTPLLTRRYD